MVYINGLKIQLIIMVIMIIMIIIVMIIIIQPCQLPPEPGSSSSSSALDLFSLSAGAIPAKTLYETPEVKNEKQQQKQ